jgi:nucleoid DNA-binding protein
MAYERFFVKCLKMKTGLSLTTCRQLTRIFLETLLDCIASDGWVDFIKIGRLFIKKRAPYKHNVFGKGETIIDPKPKLFMKLRKPAIQYLKDKMNSFGTTWELISYKGVITNNSLTTIKEWAKKKEMQTKL